MLHATNFIIHNFQILCETEIVFYRFRQTINKKYEKELNSAIKCRIEDIKNIFIVHLLLLIFIVNLLSTGRQ